MMPGAPIGGGLQQTASILAPSSGGNGANNVLMSTAEDPYGGLNTKSRNNTNQSSLIESMRKIDQGQGTPGLSKVINTLTTSNSPYVGGRDSKMITVNRAYSELQENDERNYSHNQNQA